MFRLAGLAVTWFMHSRGAPASGLSGDTEHVLPAVVAAAALGADWLLLLLLIAADAASAADAADDVIALFPLEAAVDALLGFKPK